MRKLTAIATQLNGSIIDAESTEICTVHGVPLARQQVIAKDTLVTGTVCPFASREECEHSEQIVWDLTPATVA